MTHDKNNQWKRGLYRSRNGVLLGVCRGIADYFDFSPFWVRLLAVALLFLTAFWPVVVIYIVAGMLMKPEPALPFETRSDREFYESYTSSRPLAIHRLKDTYDRLDRRLSRIESIVTSREYQWDQRMKNGE